MQNESTIVTSHNIKFTLYPSQLKNDITYSRETFLRKITYGDLKNILADFSLYNRCWPVDSWWVWDEPVLCVFTINDMIIFCHHKKAVDKVKQEMRQSEEYGLLQSKTTENYKIESFYVVSYTCWCLNSFPFFE